MATTPPPTRSLVVKCTWGADRPEACHQALNVAASAVAAGAHVSLWLAGEGSWLAVPGRAAEVLVEHGAPLADLLDVVLADGSVTLCTQCAVRRGLTQDDLLDGVRVAGAAAFTEEVLAPGAQALVY